jgi:hypothetical protein
VADTGREARRQANFARLQAIVPLQITVDDLTLPDGDRLEEDEFVVRTAKDWGVNVKPLILTTRRLICRYDPAGPGVASIPLRDIREVRLRKHFVAFATVVIDTSVQRQVAIPAHINGNLIRADIATMADFARGDSVTPTLSVLPSPPPSDRYEQLERLGKLKDSGVLSEAEFEKEKARILKQP